MFEDRFGELLRLYPQALSDRRRFAALMKDYFPDKQMQQNLIMAAYSLGIAEALTEAPSIDHRFAFRFVRRLTDEYGISRLNADWAVSVWCVCYGERLLRKPCDIRISGAKSGGGPAIRSEGDRVGGRYSDLFLYAPAADGFGIQGFTGDIARTLVIPNACEGRPVTRILASAFEGCAAREVVITEGISAIEAGAFRNCRQLRQVMLPTSLEVIGDEAFLGCEALGTAALPGKLERIGCRAFAGTALKEAALPEHLRWLGEAAYEGCADLTSLQFPEQLEEIPARVVKNCAALRKLRLPEDVREIGKEAFSGCARLADMIVPETVTAIAEDAFSAMGPDFTMLCHLRSAAERYARAHNIHAAPQLLK